MNKRFKIVIGSPVDYEKLVAYIVIDDKYVALLNQDKEELEIEFFDEPKIMNVPYEIFLEALIESRKQLLRLK